MDDFKRKTCKHIGIGGMHCNCCAPPPGKKRDQIRRRARHALKSQDRKEQDD